MVPSIRAALACLALTVATVGAGDQTPDPLMGTRVLNVEKSMFWAGAPIRNLTLTYEPAGEGLKATARGVLGDGSAWDLQFTADFDGRAYPAIGATAWDRIALRRLDRFTIEQTRTKGGQVVGTARLVVSPDGRVLVVTEARPDGTPTAVLVYEKR